MPPPAYLVFISHSWHDRWIAQQMARLIEAKGRRRRIAAFLDVKDIQGGDPIPETVRRNIRRCDEFLVLLTQNSINRPWVLMEIGGAYMLEKQIVAVIDKVALQDLPDVIAPNLAMDLNDFDDYLTQLMQRVARKQR